MIFVQKSKVLSTLLFLGLIFVVSTGCQWNESPINEPPIKDQEEASSASQKPQAFQTDEVVLNQLSSRAASQDWDGVIQMASQVLLERPDNTGVRNYLGWAYAETGQWKKAIPELNQVIAIEPENENAFSTLAWAYAGNQEWERSIESANQVLKRNPSDVHAYTNLGWAYSGKGDVQAAIQAYQQALKLTPNEPSIYYSLANVHCDAGQLESAQAIQKTLLELNAQLADELEQRLAKNCHSK